MFTILFLVKIACCDDSGKSEISPNWQALGGKNGDFVVPGFLARSLDCAHLRCINKATCVTKISSSHTETDSDLRPTTKLSNFHIFTSLYLFSISDILEMGTMV